MAPPSRRGLAGFMRDLLVEVDGVETRGTRHFAPGALIYVHPPYSGDGWERTFLTGTSRVDGRLFSALGPRSRVGRQHVMSVTDPSVLTLFATRRRGYWEPPGSDLTILARFSEDPDAREIEAGWARGGWDALTGSLLTPVWSRLLECLCAVLDCDPSHAQGLVARSEAGRAVVEAATGATNDPSRRFIRRVQEAWEALCPEPWTRDVDRRFSGTDSDAEVLKDRPQSLLAVVSFCALGSVVETAESLARELAWASGGSQNARVTWRILARSGVSEPLIHAASPADPPSVGLEGWSRLAAALTPAIKQNDFHWRRRAEAQLQVLPLSASRDPLAALLALTRLGVVVERITPDRVELLCPTLGVRSASRAQRRVGE